MEPFHRTELKESLEQTVARLIDKGLHPELAVANARHLHRCAVWKNDLYQVLIDREPPHGLGPECVLWYLSIRRLDQEPIHDWRHLQQIKNELCGKEVEGVELYPAHSRVVDGANQYHMHVVMEPQGFRFPWGFTPSAPAINGPENAAKYGAKQRAHE
jgi:hypothetical protein